MRRPFGSRLVAIATTCVACGCGSSSHAPAASPSGAAAPPATSRGNGVVQISGGDFHTCALLGDGTVRCWGRDRDGELGDGGAGGDATTPRAVPGLTGAEEIAAGSGFTCARVHGGSVVCWGSGKILGDDVTRDKIAPSPVPGLADVVELDAGGYVACARTAQRTVRCWGLDDVVKGAPTDPVVEIAASAAHACARLEAGSVRCWGEGPWSGMFSDPKIGGAHAITTGDSFACAAVSSGETLCWGRNDEGELGVNPDEDNHAHPLSVRDITGATKLDSGESSTCALVAGGVLRCWGSNSEGELGRGMQSIQELAGPVSGIPTAITFAMGADFGCALLPDQAVACWGSNHKGQVGDGTNEDRPTPVRIRL